MSFTDLLAVVPNVPLRALLSQLPVDTKKALRQASSKTSARIASLITALRIRWQPDARSTYQRLHKHFPNVDELTIVGEHFTDADLAELLLLRPALLLQIRSLTLGFKVEPPSMSTANLQALVAQLANLKDLNFTWDLAEPSALTSLTALSGLTRLNVSGVNSAADAHLIPLSGLPHLAVLDTSKVGPTVRTIEGTFLQEFKHSSSLTSLEMRSCHLAPAGVAALGQLPRLKHLDLGASTLGGPEMAPISRLCSLQTLVLSGGNLTPEGLDAIASLAELTRLNINAPESTPLNAVSHLGSLVRLEQLDAQGCPTNEDGFAALAHLPALNLLSISIASISGGKLKPLNALVTLNAMCTAALNDAGLAALAEACPNVEQMLLKGLKGITDAGMAMFVERATHIKRLVLEGLEGVTDKGMDSLAGLSNVEFLGLGDTNGITPVALQSLARMPALRQLKMCRAQLLIRHRMFAQLKLEAHIAALMPNVEFEFMYFRGRYALFT